MKLYLYYVSIHHEVKICVWVFILLTKHLDILRYSMLVRSVVAPAEIFDEINVVNILMM